MIQCGQDHPLGLEAGDDGLRIHAPGDHLDGGLLREVTAAALTEIDRTHAAAIDSTQDAPCTQFCPNQGIVIDRAGGTEFLGTRRRRFEKVGIGFELVDQGVELGAQRRITPAEPVEQGRVLLGSAFHCGRKRRLQLLPT